MAAAHTHQVSAPTERRSEGRAGSRRIFSPQFKLQVLEAYRRDAQCRGNQRATARKFGIHRRQIQKWLQAETTLRAALLRRAPQTAASPPPYAAGSPESARFPSPPPATVASPPSVIMGTTLPSTMGTSLQASLPTSAMQTCSPSPIHHAALPAQVQVTLPVPVPAPVPVPIKTTTVEPIDLSVRRLSSPTAPQPVYPKPSGPEVPRKPFKLFRPYLLDDKEDRRSSVTSLSSSYTTHVSAFVPVATGCAMSTCGPRWNSSGPAFPLR